MDVFAKQPATAKPHHPAIKSIAFTPGTLHDDQIEWPNGQGWTPCTKAYRRVWDERELVRCRADSFEDLDPPDYDHVCRLNDLMANMMEAGHLGKGEKYG
jgi:hypothetical protein